MQNKYNSKTYLDSVIPQVPDSYYKRMEAALDALPIESARTVSVHTFTKKQIIILVAALITLLTIGTAFAIGISRMQEMRDGGLNQLDQYSGFVYGTDAPDADIPSDPTQAEFYVPVGYDVGLNDKNGNWQPVRLIVDEAVSAGEHTLKLTSLRYHPQGEHKLYATIKIEADRNVAYHRESLTLSINGGDPIPEAGRGNPMMTPVPAMLEPNGDGRYAESYTLYFDVDENPFRPNTTFVISGKLNGEPVALTYTLTVERFEALRQETLKMLDNYAALLNDVPEETIPVGTECIGYRITEVAIKGHWLYYTVETVPAYWQTHDTWECPPYGTYDDGGTKNVIDGMLCPDEFISGNRGAGEYERTQLSRCYLPYSDALPKESLISLFGATFRIEWATGKAALPKDEAEFLAWRQESETLSAQNGDYDANHIAKPNAKGETFTVAELIYMDHAGLHGNIGLILETEEPVKKPFEGKDRQPIVTVNGAVFEGMTMGYSALDKFTGGTENGGRRVGFVLYGPAYRTLPETFEVTVIWNGSTVTFTMHKSDLVRCYEGEGAREPFDRDYRKVLGL